MLQIIKA